MDVVQELQLLRAELIREVDDKIGRIIEAVRAEQEAAQQPSAAPAQSSYEAVYPLAMEPGVFKGRRPTAVIFPDGHRVQAPTWKRVFVVVLKQCNSNAEKHRALVALCGRVMGRNRVLLDSRKGRMRSPVQIDRSLYAETHYDTETLLRILTTRILDAVAYDYSGIQVALKED